MMILHKLMFSTSLIRYIATILKVFYYWWFCFYIDSK